MENLARLCKWHHYLKTNCGHTLSGKPGTWQWHPPGGEPEPGNDPDPPGTLWN